MTSRDIIGIDTCAEQLGVGKQYVRKLFKRTEFWPVFRISQVPFYLGYDFDDWKTQHWREGKFVNGLVELTTEAA